MPPTSHPYCPPLAQCLAIGWLLLSGLPLRAELIAHEPFDYAPTKRITSLPNVRMEHIGSPGPTEALVFLTEHERSLDDRYFGLRAHDKAWINNWFAAYLGRGATLWFADGHAEFWRWRETRTLNVRSQGESQPRNLDLARLQLAVAHPYL